MSGRPARTAPMVTSDTRGGWPILRGIRACGYAILSEKAPASARVPAGHSYYIEMPVIYRLGEG
jgi:hypothetical protein